jgi:hypothetical protein
MRSQQRVLLLLTFCSAALFAQNPSRVTDEHILDLRSFDFPTDANPVVIADVKARVFFLSNENLALYFEQKDSAPTANSRRYRFLTVSTTGQMIAQHILKTDGGPPDVKRGPNETILLTESERLDFFDSHFHLVKTRQLPANTIGTRFESASRQLVVITSGDLKTQVAHFVDADTFDEVSTVVYPKQSVAIFGEKQLGYVVPGYCQGALHIEPDKDSWRSLEALQTCNALTFVNNEALAYATDQDLYVVDKTGKELFRGHIPAPESFHLPGFVGISDDRTRIAIMANMKRSIFAVKRGTWPYYNEVYSYDLNAKKLLFKHALTGGYAAALSPDGHHLATIESGSLKILFIP